MNAGESKNNIAHNIDGCICVDAMAGLDAVEISSARLRTDVLRRGLLFPKDWYGGCRSPPMFITDLLLNQHFNAPLLGPEMIGNYLA